MVAPSSGPTWKVVVRDIDDVGSSRLVQSRYKQAKPYNLVLPYYMEKLLTTGLTRQAWGSASLPYTGGVANVNTGKSPIDLAVQPWLIDEHYSKEKDQAVNTARNNFLSLLDEAAESAVALVERKQSVDMIANRGKQLLGATLALKRGGPVALAKALKLSINPKVRKDQKRWSRSRQFSRYWLEYHFGWAPLVSDIAVCVDRLQKPFAEEKLSAVGARVSLAKSRSSTYYNGDTTDEWWNQEGSIRCKVGGVVRITNPNLYLADRLGLVNPATVAWELVPFSFVVDWFVNVNDFLSSFSELHGVTFDQAYHTWKANVKTSYRRSFIDRTYYSPPPRLVETGGHFFDLQTEGRYLRRTVGLPSVVLGVRPPWRVSVTRALTAISLLVQQGLK